MNHLLKLNFNKGLDLPQSHVHLQPADKSLLAHLRGCTATNDLPLLHSTVKQIKGRNSAFVTSE